MEEVEEGRKIDEIEAIALPEQIALILADISSTKADISSTKQALADAKRADDRDTITASRALLIHLYGLLGELQKKENILLEREVSASASAPH